MRRVAWAVAIMGWILAGDVGAATNQAIRVALYDDEGSSGKGVPRVMELLGGARDIEVTSFAAGDFKPNALEGHGVVVFTGGSGSRQAEAIGEVGREEVRRFVREGGGYVGICAGAYLACAGFSWGVGVLDAKTVSPKWRRGKGTVKIEVTPSASSITGLAPGEREIRYANGPIIVGLGRVDIPDFEPLAVFRSELAENGSPVGAMLGSPAMACGRYGRGRVFISSPHPEQTVGMEKLVECVIRWVASGRGP
ncbi:MAG: biofilm PGA synthesis protein PgaB [Verrucomicrobiae bacterium]|nr:biofilm PGA synthesis protein PgaB [Verrucomicrobiae bacterium]